MSARPNFQQVLGDDSSPLDRRIAEAASRPLLLWGHREVGRAALVRDAAARAHIPYRQLDAVKLGSWDGFRDLTDSGSFRPISIESFLAKGEPAAPDTFHLQPDSIVYIRGLNRIPARVVDTILEQLLEQRLLLNNPVPEGVRVVAAVFPPCQELGLELLGDSLRAVWEQLEERASLDYGVTELSAATLKRCDHWAVLPSVERFVTWGRGEGLAEEVLAFLEREAAADPPRGAATLYAVLLAEADLLSRPPSPHAFSDLAALLTDRRLYFCSRAVKQALREATSATDFADWLREHVGGWDPERWIDAGASHMLRGEAVSGGDWLGHLIEQIATGETAIAASEIPSYAAFERRTLQMWATQELGDEIGDRFLDEITVTAADVAHLG